MATVTVTIDNRQIEVEQGITILEAAKKIGLKIPTLCHMREINEIGSCRICIVEVQGARTLQAACNTSVRWNGSKNKHRNSASIKKRCS